VPDGQKPRFTPGATNPITPFSKSLMPENYSMPTPLDPDGPTAWVRGDLPAEAEPEAPQDSADAAGGEPEAEISPVEQGELSAEVAETLEELAEMYSQVTEPVLEAPLEVEVVLPAVDAAAAEPAEPIVVVVELPAEAAALDAQPLAPSAVEMPPIELPPAEPLELEALIESLLFVADGAVPVARLAEALEVSTREIEAGLAALVENSRHRGLSVQRFRDKVQLTTAPAAAGVVERFLGLAALTPLSRAALEALAIVAYQQPVTRPQIEAIRGVNSDSVIKNLLGKGLIEESGRAEGPGRPVLYSTTSEFMQHFGLAALSDLPPLSLPETATRPTAEAILKG
jgi:segregation and condensation protein B